MEKPISQTRIASIDLLKGLVMVIMALDHTRDYFHGAAFFFDPTDPNQSTLPIFFTRWITHFCAPTFSFLAGLSAYMISKRKTTAELSGFLIKRGIWLVFIEMIVVNFGWYFDATFTSPGLFVIWALGISMIILGLLVLLPRKLILIFSLLLIFGHNLLDGIHFKGSVLWAMLHDGGGFKISENGVFFIAYPVIPWIAVMSLGYCFGTFYDKSYDSIRRKKTFNIMGITALVCFFILRYGNIYGNPTPWIDNHELSKNLISFFNPMKYPPSLLYLLMTLGCSIIFLANTEKWKGKLVEFFSTFGRVPFFYYILHIYLIHLIAMLFAQLTGFGWQSMVSYHWVTENPDLKGYGFPIWVVYSVWISVILLLYPLCKKFDRYKMNHKEKWWLSYL